MSFVQDVPSRDAAAAPGSTGLRNGAFGGRLRTPVSALCWRFPSRNRSSRLREAGASDTCCAAHRTMPGRGSYAGGHEAPSVCGQVPCRRHCEWPGAPRTTAGCWHAVVRDRAPLAPVYSTARPRAPPVISRNSRRPRRPPLCTAASYLSTQGETGPGHLPA
jgi:hypothetical protein